MRIAQMMVAASAFSVLLAAPAMADANLGSLTSGIAKVSTESFAPATTFSTTYTFKLDNPGSFSATLADLYTGFANVGDLQATFYTGLPSGGSELGSLSADFINNESSGTFSGLAAGTYSAKVTGQALDSVFSEGGSYSLSLVSQTSAAPAPGPAGILVAGAGGLVIAARRRRKAKLANA